MTRGDVNHVKIHYKGNDEDFLVFLDSVDDYQRWLGDKSVPLAQVVSSFKVFTTHRYALLPFHSSLLLFSTPPSLSSSFPALLGLGNWDGVVLLGGERGKAGRV
jgi:hypothetical protein